MHLILAEGFGGHEKLDPTPAGTESPSTRTVETPSSLTILPSLFSTASPSSTQQQQITEIKAEIQNLQQELKKVERGFQNQSKGRYREIN